jgi:uncharacterized protein YfaS (alpha-2-macroglobulin family)
VNDRKDLALVVLSVGMLLFAILWLAERGSAPADRPAAEIEAVADRDAVQLIDVALDRERRAHLDLVFDRALGDTLVGDVLGQPPVRLSPHTGGIWRWQAANVLRFTPTHRLAPATRYTIELLPSLLVPEGMALVGERRFEAQTDAFQVERVIAHEEPEPDADHRVRLRGELRFNYPVEPRELAPRIALLDPDAPDAKEVAVALESRHGATVIGWRSDPIEKSHAERELRLTIAADLTPAEGNVPLGADFTKTLPLGSRDVLVVRQVRSQPGEDESGIEIDFSAAVDARTVMEHLTIEPPVEVRAKAARNRLTLRGPLSPESRYTLTLRAGLTATDGATLPEAHRVEVSLAPLPMAMGFRGEGMFLPARGARRIGLETTNVERVTLTIDRVYRNNVLYLVQQQGYSLWQTQGHGRVAHVFGDRLHEEKLEIGGPRNRRHTTEIRVDEKLGEHEPGFYRVGVRREGSWAMEQRWLLVTDLGIVAKRSAEDLLVWVSSFDDLSPVAGAAVRVVSGQNQLVAVGRTDARGLLHLRDQREHFAKHRPAYIVVERGEDWSFIALDHAGVETSGLDVGGAPALSTGYDAFLYGERDLYRPGETARGVAIVRDAQLAVPPEMPLRLRHRGPQGRERGTQRLSLGAEGAASFEVPLPETAYTGSHSLELVIGEDIVGRYRFQVEEFVPDRISVEIERSGDPPDGAATPPIGPGHPLRYRVSSHYLFGPPAAGLDVESRVSLETAAFAPPGFAGFLFGNADRKFARRELLSREGTLDETGGSRFEVEIPAGLEVPASLVAVVTARVQERGGRGVAAQTRVPVHPVPYYLGLRKIEEGYAEPGEPVAFELVGAAPDGSEVPTGALRVELLRDEWQTVLRRTPSGSYRYDSELEARQIELTSLPAGTARHRFELVTGEYGSYRVVATDPETGASTRLSFYASGWGFAPWAVENPGRIELDLERDDLRAGERAVVQVRAPFAGRLLLTVERDRVLHTEVRELAGNTARIELPVRGDWRPNVYVTATLVRSARALEPGTAARAFGAVPLSVERAMHQMSVRLDAPEEVRPRGPLELVAHAAPGSQVTLAAVDEGVLQLIGQATPDAFAHFYRRRGLAVSSHDIFSFLLPDFEVEGEARAGGGLAAGLRTQMLRTEGIRRVKPVAFWSGLLTADAGGEVRARFELPEFQGALRIMAVAHHGADFGAATGATRVRDPLVLLPTTPRFLSHDERAELPVTVRNDTGVARTVKVRLEATGPVELPGGDTRELELEDGAEAGLHFTLATGSESGEVSLRFSADAGSEHAVAERSLGLRPDLPARTLERAGTLTSSGVTLEEVAALRAEGRSRSLRIAPSPLVQLYGSLHHLLVYPYGCLEQTVSRAFPLVSLADWAQRLEPDLLGERDPAVWVEEAIWRVASMQLPEGGFSLWPRGREAHPWASLYAAHFLMEAERAGHTSAGATLPGALAYAQREALAKPRYSGPELERVVYALYVLARAGRADRATMDFVRERHAEALRSTSRVLLGAAYAATGDPDALPALAAAVEDAEQVRRQTGGNFGSTTRNRALLLLGLLDADPDDPRIGALATRLARDALAERWSTQEAAYALLALGQLERGALAADYRGSVWVAGERVGDFDTETTVFEGLPIEGEVEIRLESAASDARAYYALHDRGTPTDAAFAPEASGLEVERTWLSRDGARLDAPRVRQGDLVVARVRVRSQAGRVENLVVQQLLPAGFEVENPRLESSESLPWARDADLTADYVDLRDDRALIFTRLPNKKWRTAYVLMRAVTPGTYRLPPVQVEAMYAPDLRAVGERGELVIEAR